MSMAGALDPDRLFRPVSGFERIGLAVSGGADSLALLVLFARWQPSGGKPAAIVYTLNHGLRTEAEAETAFVADVAARFGFQARVLRWEGDKPASGIQAAARQARYRLIGAAMAEDGAAALLTAHHQRDQAETVLMRIAHGSGVSGLGGMRDWAEVEGVRVFRPLLEVEPQILRAIVEEVGLSAVEDPSNRDLSYERVRWRQALPGLAELGLDAGRLTGMARRIARVDSLAGSVAAEFVRHHAQRDGFGVYSLPLTALADAHRETQVRVLALLVESAGGGASAGLGQIEELAAGIAADGGWQDRTLGGARITLCGTQLTIFREMGRMVPGSVSLPVGGPVVWDGRFVISCHAPALEAVAARDVTRAGVEKLIGPLGAVPMAAVRAAPVIRDADGDVVAIGEHVLTPVVDVKHVALTSAARNCGKGPLGGDRALVSPE